QQPEQLHRILQQVNHHLLEASNQDPGLADMHSTFCALVFNQRTRRAVWLHVGDSRIYHFRQGQLISRTRDHSMLQWLQDHQQTAPSCQRNTLYSALGEHSSQLQVDVSSVFSACPGDWFLLCSDGLWEHFSDDELGLMGSNLRLQPDCCTHIHQVALSRARGRADNLSSILLFIEHEGTQSGSYPWQSQRGYRVDQV
ncbi:MAG TPA: protein phosphatase 2C domain-containing protein, partial [Limnobacter sp.]|nr:protein phosphatase 2C domain-containing protein [Limnobacter sp.]